MGRVGSKWALGSGFVGPSNRWDTGNQRKKIQDGTRASNLSTQKKDGAIHKNMQIERGVGRWWSSLRTLGTGGLSRPRKGLASLVMEEKPSTCWSSPAFAKALEVLPTGLDVWHFAWFTFYVSATKEDVCCRVLVDVLYHTKEVSIYLYFAKSFFFLWMDVEFYQKLFWYLLMRS